MQRINLRSFWAGLPVAFMLWLASVQGYGQCFPVMPTITSFTASKTVICPGEFVIFSLSYTAGNSPSIQILWKINGVAVVNPSGGNLFQTAALSNNDVVTATLDVLDPCGGSKYTQIHSNPITITVSTSPVQVEISGGDNAFVCYGSTDVVFHSIRSNLGSQNTTSWYINGSLFTSSTATTPDLSVTIPVWNYGNGAEIKTVVSTAGNCDAFDTQRVYIGVDSEILSPVADGTRCQGSGSDEFTMSATIMPVTFSWGLTAGAGTVSSTGVVTWSPIFSGDAYVSTVPNGCTSQTSQVHILVKPAPDVLNSMTDEVCGWEPFTISYDVAPRTQIAVYDATDNLLQGSSQSVSIEPLINAGTYSYRVETIGENGCRSVTRANYNVVVTDNCDDKLNWIQSEAYDHDGTLISTSRKYYDWSGIEMQSQNKFLAAGRIFASQTIRDRFNRPALQTLAAPIAKTDFNYRPDFVLDASGKRYDYLNFDQPTNIYNAAAPASSQPGTLGYYYSANNTQERDVPITQYPYSRSEFYNDGSGETKRKAAAGDQHRLGADHEILTGTFPVFQELDDYVTKRQEALGVVTGATLANEALQALVRDENGRFGISISDKSGKTIFSARAGTESDHALQVANVVQANADPASSDYRPFIYFYLLEAQAVSISGAGSYVVEDLITGQTFLPSGQWPVGFYRIKLASGAIQLSYRNYFLDVSYQFYNDADRLVASISPNGYLQWTGGTGYNTIDKTTYEYNHQGWLLATVEADAGRTEYVYRKDGRIRFSQNAKQRTVNRFSYTHYDRAGRTIESGEYAGESIPFVSMTSAAFGASAMKALLEKRYDEITWPTTDLKDWVRTTYDLAVSAIPHVPSSYVQDYVAGTVSQNENAHIQTWYSYDEQGRVLWMAQQPRFLDRTFVTDYQYDFLGNVLSVRNAAYTGGALREQFFHHYEYDRDNRLSKAYTSVDGEDRKLRATYDYYLHGPLKRIVLGDAMQGIDFVYNIQGWLTQINHPDPAQDPGEDGNDVFGMIIDYYESDVSGLLTTSPQGNIPEPIRWHGPRSSGVGAAATNTSLIRFETLPSIPSDARLPKSYSAENTRYGDMFFHYKTPGDNK